MSERDLLIGATQLSYPAADGDTRPHYRAAYDYAADRFTKIPGSFLFWGPYLDLDAGVYVIKLIGEVEGQLSLEFIHGSGAMRIKRIGIDKFATSACVVLVRPVHRFEIRALKTRELERLRLEGFRLQCVHRDAEGP